MISAGGSGADPVDSYDEGTYTFKIEGFHSSYTEVGDPKATLTVSTFTIYANCKDNSIASVSASTGQTFGDDGHNDIWITVQ